MCIQFTRPLLKPLSMKPPTTTSEYLVISRGKWDPDLTPETIQDAIDRFYAWIDGQVAEGKMRYGERLSVEGKVVSRNGVITDGPYGEAKEVVGGYWFVVAETLEQAAQYMTGNPVLACGLDFEIRPLELIKASAYETTNETPAGR